MLKTTSAQNIKQIAFEMKDPGYAHNARLCLGHEAEAHLWARLHRRIARGEHVVI